MDSQDRSERATEPTAAPFPANDNNPLAKYLSQDQAAELLGVSVRTLQRLHASRRGPARIKVGRLIMYRIEAVCDWLEANESGRVCRPPRRSA